jgi:hypothetical protein
MHYILLAKQRLLGIFTLGWFLLSQTLSAQISIYSVPKALYYGAHNDDFTVRVRSKGGQWQDLYEYKVKVDADNVQEASMVYFDFEKEVEVAVTKNNGNIQTLNIRPKPKGLNYKLVNNTVFFHLNSPANLSLEINGDKLHNLHIFAGNLLKDIPQSTDKNVLYFGLHNPTDSLRKGFVIPSNTKVYIDGGAVLKGKLICDKVENVKILEEESSITHIEGWKSPSVKTSKLKASFLETQITTRSLADKAKGSASKISNPLVVEAGAMV